LGLKSVPPEDEPARGKKHWKIKTKQRFLPLLCLGWLVGRFFLDTFGQWSGLPWSVIELPGSNDALEKRCDFTSSLSTSTKAKNLKLKRIWFAQTRQLWPCPLVVQESQQLAAIGKASPAPFSLATTFQHQLLNCSTQPSNPASRLISIVK
jgi:hypothetical protein